MGWVEAGSRAIYTGTNGGILFNQLFAKRYYIALVLNAANFNESEAHDESK